MRPFRPLPSLLACLLAAGPAGAASWTHAHSDAGNSGFLDVMTTPARVPVATVPGLGTIAPGAGPVVAGDGTVYVGDEGGTLRAFDPDGVLRWSQPLGQGYGIVASPLVDADGSVFVVGVRRATDHRVDPPVKLWGSELVHFAANGTRLWAAMFPDHGSIASGADYGTVFAAPNIVDTGGVSVVLDPVSYRERSGEEVRLAGFRATDGALLVDTRLALHTFDVLGGNGWSDGDNIACLATLGYWCLQRLMLPSFSPGAAAPLGPDELPSGAAIPAPGVMANGEDIVATDRFGAVVDLHYVAGAAPGAALVEDGRLARPGSMILGAPSLLPNGERVSTEADYDGDAGNSRVVGGHLLFTGPLETQVADASFPVATTPAHTGDGRIVIAQDHTLQVLDGQTPLVTLAMQGASLASPAVSRNEIFVSTASGLATYDAGSLALLALYPWTRGGLSTPAIGPTGRIYAIADDTLYVFRGPACTAENPCHLPPGHIPRPRHF